LDEIEWLFALASEWQRENAAREIVRRAIAGGTGPETPSAVVRDVLTLACARRDHPAVPPSLGLATVWETTVARLESLLAGIEAAGGDAERIAVLLDLVDAVATGRRDLPVVRHTIARIRAGPGVVWRR
jgi:hypothetical protein